MGLVIIDLRQFLLIAATGQLLGSALVASDIPVVGFPVPELKVLDDTMLELMEENSISAGSLSVMRNGAIVFHHVYGWQDREKTKPLRPDAMFRVASVTKPFTAAAVRQLISDGEFSLDSKVFSLGVPEAGLLDYVPFGTPDVRLGDVTVDHLLRHYGGWDRTIAGDLTYREKTIADAMDVASPPGRENTVRYIMGQPLQYDPGTTYAYSNIGYLLLGLIVETASGKSYEDYVGEHVVGASGGTADGWLMGRTFLGDQDPREPFYDSPGSANNVFYPDSSVEPTVEWPYGSFDLEARTGQGRIVAHGSVILKFLNKFQVSGPNIGRARPLPGGWRWNHTGSLSGTNSLARQRGDGINYAVIFNKRPSSGTSYASRMRTTLDDVFDSGTITWPTTDISELAPPVPTISLDAATGSLTCETEWGLHYQWQHSNTLGTWSEHLEPFVGSGETVGQPIESDTRSFYRVFVRQ
ncbi:beta-lactamase family protein [Verrucomicrobiales bacterium]|nr:beta-lactamase family protein [Verrucomicrobiales bacterium]